MPQENKITVQFKASGDKALVRAIQELHLAQVRLTKGTKAYDRAVKRLRLDKAKLQKEFGLATKNSRLLANSFATLRSKMLLVSFGAGILAATIGKLTKLFAEQEAAEQRLSTALGTISQRLLDFAAAQQLVTTFGDEVTISAMAQAAAFTNNQQAIEQMTIAAQNLAAGRGMDLKTSMDLISKSVFTSTNALNRYMKVQTSGLGTTDKFNTIMKAINDQFGGQAAGRVNTYAGATEQLANTWGDLGEKLGKVFAEGLLPIIQALNTLGKILQLLPLKLIIKLFAAFSAQLIFTRINFSRMLTAMKAAQVGMTGLSKTVTAAKVAFAALQRTVVAFLAIEVIMRLIGMLTKTKKVAKAAAIEVVDLGDAFGDLEMTLASITKISEIEKLMKNIILPPEARAEYEAFTATINNLAEKLSEVFFGAGKASSAVGLFFDVAETPSAVAMKKLFKEISGFEFDPHGNRHKQLEELSKELLFQGGLPLWKLKFSDIFNVEAIDLAIKGNETAAKGAKVLAESISNLDSFKRRLLGTDKQNVELQAELRKMQIANLKWSANIIPNLEYQAKLAELKNEHTGTELELQKILLEGEMREIKGLEEKIPLIRKWLEEKNKNNDILKEETFWMNSVNRALLDGINTNGRFAESFGNMIKKMAAEIVAHMATFLLFKVVIGGGTGGLSTAFQYAQSKIMGTTFHNGGFVAGGNNVPAVLQGGEYVMNRNAVDSIGIENLNRMNQSGSGGVVVNFSGNVMSQDFIENDAIPRIKEAIRRGADIGVS